MSWVTAFKARGPHSRLNMRHGAWVLVDRPRIGGLRSPEQRRAKASPGGRRRPRRDLVRVGASLAACFASAGKHEKTAPGQEDPQPRLPAWHVDYDGVSPGLSSASVRGSPAVVASIACNAARLLRSIATERIRRNWCMFDERRVCGEGIGMPVPIAVVADSSREGQ